MNWNSFVTTNSATRLHSIADLQLDWNTLGEHPHIALHAEHSHAPPTMWESYAQQNPVSLSRKVADHAWESYAAHGSTRLNVISTEDDEDELYLEDIPEDIPEDDEEGSDPVQLWGWLRRRAKKVYKRARRRVRRSFRRKKKKKKKKCGVDKKCYYARKIKSNAECRSSDKYLGKFSTVNKCMKKCGQRKDCHYFIYGKGHKKGNCYMEKRKPVLQKRCNRGRRASRSAFERDKYDFYRLERHHVLGPQPYLIPKKNKIRNATDFTYNYTQNLRVTGQKFTRNSRLSKYKTITCPRGYTLKPKLKKAHIYRKNATDQQGLPLLNGCGPASVVSKLGSIGMLAQRFAFGNRLVQCCNKHDACFSGYDKNRRSIVKNNKAPQKTCEREFQACTRKIGIGARQFSNLTYYKGHQFFNKDAFICVKR